jgi:type I restriction enzyme R subunit
MTESVVEQTALAWLAANGWQVAYGPDIAPDGRFAERADYREVVLAQRLRDALLPKLISGELRVKDAEAFP